MEAWSITTAVRDPERVPDFLAGIDIVEGRVWDNEAQADFFCQLIALKLYRPTQLSDEHEAILDDPEQTVSFQTAKEIVEAKDYVGGPEMRGRQAIQPLLKTGLVKSEPTVQITPLGRALLEGKITFQEVMLNWALKWEMPTPGDTKFTAAKGYNIKPFVGTLALIQKVNEKATAAGLNAVGIARNEFDLFGPTLIDWQRIDEFAERIIKFRKAGKGLDSARAKLESQRASIQEHLNAIAGSGPVTDTNLRSLSDYGDNAIRYFRATSFIEFRGAGRYVDVAIAAREQVNQLIANELYKPTGYASEDLYLDTLADLSATPPPWNSATNLEKVKETLRTVLVEELGVDPVQLPKAPTVQAVRVTGEDDEIRSLKAKLKQVRLAQMKAESRTQTFISAFIDEYGLLPKNTYTGYLPKPVALEFNAFKTFLSLNDALAVSPNYPTGDDGEPTSTAAGGKTDMVVEYSDFLLSVEVTMESGRNQWAMEGQPVQRHLRKLEDDSEKEAFALFLAPRIHEDTLETFWHSNKHGYQGRNQRIVPMSFQVWTDYLSKIQGSLLDGTYKSGNVQQFLKAGLPKPEHSSSTEWFDYIKSESYLESAI